MDRYQRVIQDVTATIDAMGYYDEKEAIYKVNSETTECLKELIRVLRKDGSQFPILRHLGALNIVEKDLIPILKGYCLKDETMADYTIRLLVSLTYPALIFFKEKNPETVTEKKIFLQINSFLRIYKVILSKDVKLWTVLCEKAMKIAKKDNLAQTEEERILLERILILIRNIVHVPRDPFQEYGFDDEQMICEDIVVSFKQSGILDALIYLCSNTDCYPFCFHLLEIISSLLREQSAEFLAVDESRMEHVSKKRKTCSNIESAELVELKEQEKRLKSFNRLSKFNRFRESTYIVKNVKSIGDGDLIYHKTTDDPRKISLDGDKKAVRKAKNRIPMQDESSFQSNRIGITYRRPSIKVRKLLREFCSSFIKDCYNSLMGYVKSALENRCAQENDETYYFWSAYFFMEFNRCAQFEPVLIEETFNFEYFHYLHTIIEHHLDMITTSRQDKSSIKIWSRRLHTALRAYKELLFTIASMKNTKENRILEQAAEMSQKVFYEMEYRELCLNLLSSYNEQKMSPQFLRDLIETNHVFIKMLELYSKTTETFVVKTKNRKRKKHAKKKNTEESLVKVEKIWTEIVGELYEAIQGSIELPDPEVNPEAMSFNPLSDKSRDEQKSDAFYRINKLLKEKKPAIALALCRNARENFSEDQDNSFGPPDCSPEEEVAILHEIIVSEKWLGMEEDCSEKQSDIQKNQTNEENPTNSEDVDKPDNPNDQEKAGEPNINEELNEEDDDAQNDALNNECTYTERSFDFLSFIMRYIQSKVIKAYALALKRFELNSDTLNHSIVRMFHRIAWDCKCPTFFFQLSMFRIFQRCFELSKIDKSDKLSELRNFARYIIRQFVLMAPGNDKLLIEILFWKTKKEAREIEENYVKPEPKEARKPKEKKKRKKKDGENDEFEVSDHESDTRLSGGEERIEDVDHGELSDDSGEGYQPQVKMTKSLHCQEETSNENREKITKSPDLSIHDEPFEFADELLDPQEELDRVARDADEIFASQNIEKSQDLADNLSDLSEAGTIGEDLQDENKDEDGDEDGDEDDDEVITIIKKKKNNPIDVELEINEEETAYEVKNTEKRKRKALLIDESDEEDLPNDRSNIADEPEKSTLMDLDINEEEDIPRDIIDNAKENEFLSNSLVKNVEQSNEDQISMKRKKIVLDDSDEDDF